MLEATSTSPTTKLSPSEIRSVASTARKHLDVYGGVLAKLWPAPHHDVWIDEITALVSGRSAKRKLLLIAPPGTAKSTWVSQLFPPWYLGQHPDHSLLFLTSADEMAYQFSGVVKSTLEENVRYRSIFPSTKARPNPDRGWSSDGLFLQGADPNAKDPTYRAAGFGTSTLGARVHGIIIDDPLTQSDSENAVLVEKALNFHDMTIDSRLHPDGWEIAIMTRWGMADLPSHLMKRDEWKVVVLPAINADGTPLWADRFSLAWLEAKRKEIGVSRFNCVYLCDPTALGGAVFKQASWFLPIPSNFDRLKCLVVQFWDLAYSRLDTADYTACVTLAVDRQQNTYLLDVWRERVEEQSLDSVIAQRVQFQAPHVVGVEEGLFKRASAVQDLVNRLRRKIACPIGTTRVVEDKVLRAQLPAGRAQAGMVYVHDKASWWPEFLGECLAFPNGPYDDRVDALSGATQLALEAWGQWTQGQGTMTLKFGG